MIIIFFDDMGTSCRTLPVRPTDVQLLYPDMHKKLPGVAEQARKELGDSNTKQEGTHRRQPALLE